MARIFKKNKIETNEFNQVMAEKIVNYVRFGADHETAALAAGLKIHILNEWKIKGLQEEEGFYADFLFHLQQAEAQCELLHLQRLTAGGEGASNSKFILERISQKWGEKAGPGKTTRQKQIVARTANIIDIKQLSSGEDRRKQLQEKLEDRKRKRNGKK